MKWLLLILVTVIIALQATSIHSLSNRQDADRPLLWTLNDQKFGCLTRDDTVRTLCRLQWFVYQHTGKLYLDESGFDDAPKPQTQPTPAIVPPGN